jgi:hypothetical protein
MYVFYVNQLPPIFTFKNWVHGMGIRYRSLFQRRRMNKFRLKIYTKSTLQKVLRRKEEIKSLIRELYAFAPAEGKERRTRCQNPRGRQYYRSSWHAYLDKDENSDYIRLLEDPASATARTFRRRFRVPWLFYKEELLPWTRERFPCRPDCSGREGIPTEYKLLAALRALGRGTHFDDLAEDTHQWSWLTVTFGLLLAWPMVRTDPPPG